jgi:3D (Asp-Asp-Asp) domain-containing protein
MIKKIFLVLSLLCSPAVSKETTEYLARVTYYWPGNGGQQGNKTATGKSAVCGKTIAVDPKIIPYGSVVKIPQMGKTLVAKDTGNAVKNRTASKKLGKNNIVVDVFCANKSIAMQRIKKYPMFMKVIVEKKK